MKKPKTTAIELIKSLPNNSTYEDIQYHLYVREKVERGLMAIKAGDVVSQEEAEKKVNRWLAEDSRDFRNAKKVRGRSLTIQEYLQKRFSTHP